MAMDRKPLHIVAHNIGYDIQTTNLVDTLIERGYVLSHLYLNDPTLIARFRKGKKTIILEDGYNRLRGSIEDWGKKLGLEKMRVDFGNVDDETLYAYCERDTEILLQATLSYIRFVKDNDLGELRHTIAGQAFTAFRHRFMRDDLYIHNHPDVLRLEREAYGGGMVRLFRRGIFTGETIYNLDVNSMYGYVMREYEYPKKLVVYKRDVSPTYLKAMLRSFCIIARCRVRPKIPTFRYKHNGKIVYPLCEFEGVFCTPELARLAQDDSILEVKEIAVYTKGRIFRDYVDYFWGIRKRAILEGDNVTKQMAKLFLNSLYGKFGCKGERWTPCEDIAIPGLRITEYTDLKKGINSPVIYIGNTPYIREVSGETDYSMPAIAAHVTAYARMYLWQLIETAGWENVFYSDTDSLFVNAEGYQRLEKYVAEDELGRLKLSGKADTLVLFARKEYLFGDKICYKGVNLIRFAEEMPIYVREQWSTLLSYLKGTRRGCVTVETKALKVNHTCYDGVVDTEGRVHPFTELPESWESTDTQSVFGKLDGVLYPYLTERGLGERDKEGYLLIRREKG
jgi:hypothetical protein